MLLKVFEKMPPDSSIGHQAASTYERSAMLQDQYALVRPIMDAGCYFNI